MEVTDSSTNCGCAQPHIAGIQVSPFRFLAAWISVGSDVLFKSPSRVRFDGGTGASTETVKSC